MDFTYLVMPQARRPSRAAIQIGYWKPVALQDDFWLRTFVAFVRPLRGFYKDPTSAGAYILTAYLENPAACEEIFVKTPQAYGALVGPRTPKKPSAVYAELSSPRASVTIKHCAAEFDIQKVASLDLARFAADHPALFRELQKKRALRNTQGTTVEVQFFGKSIYVETRLKTRVPGSKKRRKKLD
jgi:hypothetical protein